MISQRRMQLNRKKDYTGINDLNEKGFPDMPVFSLLEILSDSRKDANLFWMGWYIQLQAESELKKHG